MVDPDDFDLAAEHRTAKILRGHLRRFECATAGECCVDTGHIGDHGNFDRPVFRGRRERHREWHGDGECGGERRR